MSNGKAGLTAAERGVLRSLLYFHIFSYPLTAEEVVASSGQHADPAELRQALASLVQSGRIFHHQGHYLAEDQPEWVDRRKKGNALAKKRLVKARKVARKISGFPFVRGVMVSGSLSKGYMEPESDLDFFIVTRPGRLWLARTLLILYKKIFLLNSHHNWCVNYFVDTDSLLIEDRNLFTATEVAYLLPMNGPRLHDRFLEENNWVRAYYPMRDHRPDSPCAETARPWHKRLAEWLWGGRIGRWADAWCMRRTMRRWSKKFGHFEPEHFEVAMRSRKYVSKHHPGNFQQRVLKAYEENWQAFCQRHQIPEHSFHGADTIHA